MSIVAEQYEFVIGVDTHAATHTLSVITAATGAVIDQAVFSTTPSGLDRALTGITRYVDEHAALVVIEGVGSYGAGLTGACRQRWSDGRRTGVDGSGAAARCR
jgi:transposase